jgi:hypothetical protein
MSEQSAQRQEAEQELARLDSLCIFGCTESRMLKTAIADCKAGHKPTNQGISLSSDCRPTMMRQCAIRIGTVMLASTVRLAPPITISRMREWP